MFCVTTRILNLTHDEQMAVIGGLMDDILDKDYADELLNITFLNFDANEIRNVPYDNQRFLAGLIGDAYQAGQISNSDLHQIAEKLGEEGTEALILNLASNANNVRNSYGSHNVVEALGNRQSLSAMTPQPLSPSPHRIRSFSNTILRIRRSVTRLPRFATTLSS